MTNTKTLTASVKKTMFYQRLEHNQANQAEIKEGLSFLDRETYEAFPLTRWLDKAGHPNWGHPELPVEKAAEAMILYKKDPVPLELLLSSNLVQQELSHMNIKNLSVLGRTVQVTPEGMQKLGELLEREVTRADPEGAAARASLTVSERVRIKTSKRQHTENERHCRTIVQQLVSSIPQNVSMRTSYKEREREIGPRGKRVTFEEPDRELMRAGSETPGKAFFWGVGRRRKCIGRLTKPGGQSFVLGV